MFGSKVSTRHPPMDTHISVLPWPNPGGVGNSGVSSVDRAGSGLELRVCGGSPREGTFLPSIDGEYPKFAVLGIVPRFRFGVLLEVASGGLSNVRSRGKVAVLVVSVDVPPEPRGLVQHSNHFGAERVTDHVGVFGVAPPA